MLEVLYHHAKFGEARISPAAGVAKNVEFFLSVSLFVRLHTHTLSQVAPVVLREFYYLFPLKIVVRNST